MKSVLDFLLGLVKVGLLAAGVWYVVQVLLAYLHLAERPCPEFDSSQRARSVWRRLVWAGAVIVDCAVQLSRPLVDALADASADLGEWAITRHQSRLTTHPRNH
jgi:hypothetical protein